MRFRKLKIIVGIALVIFVLIIANIIFIGTFKSNDYQTPISTNPNNVQPIVSKQDSAGAVINTNQQVQASSQLIAPTVSRTSVTQTIRTRAS